MLRVLATSALLLSSRLRTDERGQTSTEYAGVLVIAVALAIAVGWFVLAPILTGVIGGLEGAMLSVFE